MKPMKSARVQSIDLLRGIVMIIMALDHAREYFHLGAFDGVDPANLETTTTFLFFTRFISHYCAPIFVFLAGTSAFLYGNKKTKGELSKFLFTRGLWLIFVEIFINGFFWWFDIGFELVNLQVLWAIGISMMVLAALIHLPFKLLLTLGIVIVAGHNALDAIVMEGGSLEAMVWYIIHQEQLLPVGPSRLIYFHYPILAWVGVMILGYCFGALYKSDFDPSLRKKYLLGFGIGALSLFLLLRGINVYGDLVPWSNQKTGFFTFLSFLNVTKYPPSLLFILITIGPGMLFLYAMDSFRAGKSKFILAFGRVPFFYYLLHILFIHLAALITLILVGEDWRIMILDTSSFTSGELASYGYPLWVSYLVWIGVVALLYPLCNWYMKYKANNKDKWWLSYL
jgi:uncharacterized membrane protein